MATGRRGRIEVNLQLILERNTKMIKKLMIVAADKNHPLSEEALDLLVMVDDPAIKN